MKSSDSSFVAKAVNSCRNVGQDVSSELPHLSLNCGCPVERKRGCGVFNSHPPPKQELDKGQNSDSDLGKGRLDL